MVFKGKVCVLFLILTASAFGQITAQVVKGEVSYLTSKNVYVRFAQTSAIEAGDTLYLASSEAPCLLVENKSSSSCVCTYIGSCPVQKGDEIVFRPRRKPVVVPPAVGVDTAVAAEAEVPILPEEDSSLYKEKIQGRISVTSYSNIASDRDDRNRLMGQFWMDAQHIRNSKFSVFAQFNYRQIFPGNTETFAPKTTYFNVYNLALRYDVSPTFSLVLGRRINPKTASLGAIDGLQAEKYFGKIYVGAIVGSRPDIQTFGLNLSLLQYGAYVGTELRGKTAYMQSTVGMIEQRNAGNIDRRYAYFQHSSTLFRSLSLFSSVELDLYQSVNGVASTTPRLTNLFVSATYRFNRYVNLMLSYDSRKRVLYYETYQTDIEQLLDDDLARQGVRARINIRPIKHLNVGLSYSKRFQTDQQNKSDNFHGSASYSKIPFIEGRIALTYNVNASNYLESRIFSATYSRPLFKDKLDADLYFRRANYIYIHSTSERRQFYYGANLSFRVNRNWALRLSGERSDFNEEVNYRIYAAIIRRFRSKSR